MAFKVIMHKQKIYYKLPVSAPGNNTEIQETKPQLSEDHMLCIMSQTFKVFISASKSTVLHMRDRIKYLKEKL